MNDGFVPALRSQHYSYLLLQLREFDAERRLNLHPVLLEHMVDLGREDMEAMADDLSRMPPLTNAPPGPAPKQAE
jgi:cytochrome c553